MIVLNKYWSKLYSFLSKGVLGPGYLGQNSNYHSTVDCSLPRSEKDQDV